MSLANLMLDTFKLWLNGRVNNFTIDGVLIYNGPNLVNRVILEPTGSVTLTPTQVLQNLVITNYATIPPTPCNITLPNAAGVLALIPHAQIGTVFSFDLIANAPLENLVVKDSADGTFSQRAGDIVATQSPKERFTVFCKIIALSPAQILAY